MHRTSRAERTRPRREGFTLVELMMVVTITAILAAIAIPSFVGYVYKSRTSEATEVIGQIKLRQEAYRSEFGAYAEIGSDPKAIPQAAANWTPADPGSMRGDDAPFPGGRFKTAWDQLGVDPGPRVYFTYAVSSGDPASAPTAAPLNYAADFWFLIQATSDLDDNGTSCTFEGYSQAKKIWYTPSKGWE